MRRFDDLLPSEDHLNAMMLMSGTTGEVSFLREMRAPANAPVVAPPVVVDVFEVDEPVSRPAPADHRQQARELANQENPSQALHQAGRMTEDVNEDALEFSQAYRLRAGT